MDAIDELVARSKNCRELRDFHGFHREHHEVLDFLVREIQLRFDAGFTAFSYNSLWEYARWKLDMEKGPEQTFLMNDHDAPMYARAITILHPEFNGRAEFRTAKADEIFGLRIEPVPHKRPKNYARRLEWEDGTSLENGWRPSVPHVVNPVATKPDIHERKPSRAIVSEEWEQLGFSDDYYHVRHIPCGTRMDVLIGNVNICPKCQPEEWAKRRQG